MTAAPRTAFVYPAPLGGGGLGHQASNALTAFALAPHAIDAIGPGRGKWAPPPGGVEPEWFQSPDVFPVKYLYYTPLRWIPGYYTVLWSRRFGEWAARMLRGRQYTHLYAVAEVALEALRHAREAGISSVLDCPTGHVAHFREAGVRESERWCKSRYRGHPTAAMVRRVEEEYELADRIRVSSEWSRRTLVARGVAEDKVHVLDQQLDLQRFQPRSAPRGAATGPLRVCFVGAVALHKGFPYLLRAMRLLGPNRVTLEIVGATGERCSRGLLARESEGLSVTAAPGDPAPAYHRAEVLVLPSLHDGFGFVAAEAMASGVPVIVSDQCGASNWVEPGVNGWVFRAGDAEALAAALEGALARRGDLEEMGRAARRTVERRAGDTSRRSLGRWFYERE